MSTIEGYILLITQFVTGEISASQFEIAYLDMFKSENDELPEYVYNALNNLFSSVDAYCGDSELRDDEDLDDGELVAKAKEALENLT